jgi:thioredoxin-dependent peroxiredoxin
MKRVLPVVVATVSLTAATPALAALSTGATAPDFSAPAAHAGETVSIDLAELLEQGPVVLYFFPSAFTDTAQTREFAEKIARFRAAGASVVGVSRDSIDTLKQFSVDEARGAFPVASANESLVNAFDVNDGAMFNTRTTYVIAPSGRIAFVHDDDEYRNHVTRSLAFVEDMKK